jgi:TPR repeat protein
MHNPQRGGARQRNKVTPRRAQEELGVLYHEGEVVLQDYAQAAVWYRKAAEQGDPDAQVALGSLYDTGLDVPPDHAQAASWYRKAAEQGDAKGQCELGTAYQRDLGCVI